MTLGEKLQALRRARGLSQEQLALALGVSRQAISKWENGESAPDLDRLRVLCAYFGVTTDYLIWDGAENAAQERAHAAPYSATGAERRAERDARRERIRSFVRQNGHWAGYAVAVIGGALLLRSLISLAVMYAVMKKGMSFGGLSDELFFAGLDEGVIGLYLTAALPYLLLYVLMIVGGVFFARWYRKKREGQDDDL